MNPQLITNLVSYINETPEILSLLYDMNLMPEQHSGDSNEYNFMLGMAMMHRMMVDKLEARNQKEIDFLNYALL